MRGAETLAAITALTAIVALALSMLGGTAHAQPVVGAVDFKEDYAKVADAGPEVGRLNISWRGIDNTVKQIDSPLRTCDDGGLYNWCPMDEEIRRYAFTGTPVHLVLVGVPSWAERAGCDVRVTFSENRRINSCSPAPEHLDEWRAFVESAVRRYGPEGHYWDETGLEPGTFDVLGWEVWNEPNLPSFWNGYQRERGETREHFSSRMVSQYVELLEATDAAIESVNELRGPAPDALTIGPSAFVKGDTSWEEEFASRPAADLLDRVSFHPYGGTVGAALADVTMMRELLPDRPVWITEHGWGAGPATVNFNVGGVVEQEQHFSEFLERLRSDHPHVARYVYYNGIDNRTNPTAGKVTSYDRMGLYDDEGREKPILAAFQVAAGPEWEVLAGPATAAAAVAAAVEDRGR